LAALSRHSGAFAFVALQQIVANASLGSFADRFDTGAMATTLWPRIGVAFGHLRNPMDLRPFSSTAGRADRCRG
jgi:hypothetical protein